MTLEYKKTFYRTHIFLSMLVAVTLLSSTFTMTLTSVVAVTPTCLGDIDFDTFPDGTVPADFTRITTQYEPCGVALFTTNDPNGPVIRSLSGSSLPNLLAPTGLPFQFTGFIGIEFSSPVSGDISVLAIEVRHGGLRLQAFDSANVLVDTYDIAPSSISHNEIMTVTGTDIVRLVISQIIPQTGGLVDGYAIDDLRFTPPIPPNQDPDCSEATPSTDSIFPPNHKMNDITISGVTDADGDIVTLTIDGITQDEPTNGLGDGDTSPDGDGVGTDTAQIRAERSGTGDGRVYEISFTADDGNGGMCTGSVVVGVPHDKKDTAIDSGQNFDSTQ
jgi:hypothetical protein